jgi:hypothetical protein
MHFVATGPVGSSENTFLRVIVSLRAKDFLGSFGSPRCHIFICGNERNPVMMVSFCNLAGALVDFGDGDEDGDRILVSGRGAAGEALGLEAA